MEIEVEELQAHLRKGGRTYDLEVPYDSNPPLGDGDPHDENTALISAQPRVPKKTCQAKADFANRLRRM
jgi:hypothetical protein